MDVRFVEPAPAGPVGLRRGASAAAVSGAAGLAGVAAVGAAFALDPAHIDDGPVLCPFRLLTGLPCPGCGLTRSWVYLAHGQWSDAWLANPFGIVSMLGVLAFVLAVVVALVRRAAVPDIARLLSSRAFLSVGAVWIAYGVGRLVWTLTT